MKDKDIIRIGIVGAGKNTRIKHIPGLQAVDGVKIISVCNRSRESSSQVARQFGIPKIYDHWWDLVAASDTDAIVIGTWPYLHCPITLAALEADKHVMCEARMAMDAREAKKMLEAAKMKPQLVSQVVPSPYTIPIDKTIKRLIAKNFLGEILAIEVRANGNAFIDNDSPFHWRQDADLSGLNIMSLGIWYEAVMRWVGETTIVTAMGKIFTKMRRSPQSGEMKAVRIPEHLNVIAEMACGAQMSISVSNIAGLSGPNEAYLYGSEGTLCIKDGSLWGASRGDSALREIAIPSHELGHWRVEEEFINAIRGLEKVTNTSFEDGYKYMAFTEAVVRSINQRKTISVQSL